MIDQQDLTSAPTGARPTMDVAEAAALLGVSPWLVLQQIAKGNLPHQRFGRRIIIPRAAFLTLNRARRGRNSDHRPVGRPTSSAALGSADEAP